MAYYQLSTSDIVVRTIDGANIPNDPDNSDRTKYEAWLAAGGVPDPYIAPIVPQQILSQDLMAQFTSDDATKIKAAVDGNMQFWLLWSAMQAQSTPMVVTNDRFLQGWSALVAVLGADRMSAISAALGVKVS